MKVWNMGLIAWLLACTPGKEGETGETGEGGSVGEPGCDQDGDDDPGDANPRCGATDCDDDDPEVNSNTLESCPDDDPDCAICSDGKDNDCDGFSDEDDPGCLPEGADSGADGGTEPVDGDGDGYDDTVDCDDTRADVSPARDELCGDELDNDCDGAVDDASADDALTWYADSDGDGFGDPLATSLGCEPPTGFVGDDNDCDDTDSAVHPDAAEICDDLDVDEDCDGLADDADDDLDTSTRVSWYLDADGDGHGDPSVMTSACAAPSGYVGSHDDCDDDQASVNPGGTELCNTWDDDCDGTVDDDAIDAPPVYADVDGDGYGDAAVSDTSCQLLAGWADNDEDCDDDDADVNPGVPERCDGFDNDCDTVSDEDDAIDAADWYADSDGDGYGDLYVFVPSCTQPAGYEDDAEDCDDDDADINPGASEHCDDLDEDCDGAVDNDPVDGTRWYRDADGDGFGDSDISDVACDAPRGYGSDATDCDDGDDEVYPGADDLCPDGVDNDCDLAIDQDSFEVVEEVDIGSGSDPIYLIDLDLDGANGRDLVVAAYGERYAYPITNDGNGTFSVGTRYDVGREPRSLSGGRIWSGSGDDFAAVNVYTSGGARARFCKVDSSGAVNACYWFSLDDDDSSTSPDYGTTPRAVQMLDCNTNGSMDAVAIGDNDDGYLRFWRFSADTDMSSAPTTDTEVTLGTPYEALLLAAGASSTNEVGPLHIRDQDLDGVGADDLVVSNGGDGSFSVVLIGSSSCDVLSESTEYIDASDASMFVSGTALQDFVGTNASDVAVAWRSSSGDGFSIYENDGSGNLTLHSSYAVPASANPDAIVGPDLDGDGDRDLAVVYTGLGTVGLWINDASTEVFLESAELELMASGSSSSSYDPREIVFDDYDQDGDEDLAVANYGADSVSVLHNQCDP